MSEKTSGTSSGKQASKTPKLPARGTVNKNVHPYKMGLGTVEKIAGYKREGETVMFKRAEEVSMAGESATLFIFEVNGEQYGIKAEDIELPN